jgi:hypothetical protein
MKTDLRLRPHLVTPGAQVIEVWAGDQLLATVVGAEAGVRVISQHALVTTVGDADPRGLAVVEVTIRR